MDGKTLQATAEECAEGLPEAALTHPFGPDWEVFKVHDKVFALMTSVPGQPVVIVKADPDEVEALSAAHADISPGYHMNKKHWITLAAGRSITKKLVRELVTESYWLVVGKLPVSQRPARADSVGGRVRVRA